MAMIVRTHDGRSVSAERQGEGPLVVLVPPGASSGAAWRRVIAELGEGYASLAVHPSGHGETEMFAGGRAMTIADEAGAALALIPETEGPVHLVGHSYGGAIAVEMALTAPARFATLTLIEPALYPLLSAGGRPDLGGEVEAENARFIDRANAGERERAFEDYFDYYNGASGFWRAMPQAARDKVLPLAPVVAAALGAVQACARTREDLGRIALPVVVAWGAETDPVHAALSRIVADAIPDAQAQTVPGAGHMCSLTHPAEVAALIRRQAAFGESESGPRG